MRANSFELSITRQKFLAFTIQRGRYMNAIRASERYAMNPSQVPSVLRNEGSDLHQSNLKACHNSPSAIIQPWAGFYGLDESR